MGCDLKMKCVCGKRHGLGLKKKEKGDKKSREVVCMSLLFYILKTNNTYTYIYIYCLELGFWSLVD